MSGRVRCRSRGFRFGSIALCNQMDSSNREVCQCEPYLVSSIFIVCGVVETEKRVHKR